MKPLEVWTCQRAENLKKKSSKIPKHNYAAKMVSAARRQNIGGGGGGAPNNKKRGGGGAQKLSAAAARRGRRTALVLRHMFPFEKPRIYDLRPRAHNFILPL